MRLDVAVLLVLLVFSHMGCGIKGPPLPAGMTPLPAVSAISYRLDGNTVTLSWHLPDSLTRRQADGASFGAYMSRRDLTAPPCDDCPLVFERVAAVPYVDSDGRRFTTALTVTPGYRYAFKVRLESGEGIGEETDPIRFDFPAQGSFQPEETP